MARDRAIDLARALHSAGVQQNSAARPAVALKTLRRALSFLAPDDSSDLRLALVDQSDEAAALAVRILVSIAKAEGELSGLPQALSHLDAAAELARDRADIASIVPIQNQRGLLFLRFGDVRRALIEFDLDPETLESAEPLERSNVLLNRGVARLSEGSLIAARADFAACAEVARVSELGLLRSMALHNQGYAEFLVGNIPAALAAMAEAAEIDAGVPVGVALLDRARVLIDAGLAREADEAMAQAATIFRRDRMSQDLAETSLSRAEAAMVAGDLLAARRFAGRARDLFRRRDNQVWRRMADVVLLQADLAAGRPPSRLFPLAVRLQQELTTDGLHSRARTAGLVAAEAALLQGNLPRARAALDVASPSDVITVRLHTTYLRAKLDAAVGDIGDARRLIRSGLADLASYQASFGGIDLRTASAIHGRRLADLDVELAVRHGSPGAVLMAVERGRAVSSRLPAVRPPADARSAQLLAELRPLVETIRSDASQAAKLQPRRAELERQIQARSWTLAGGGQVQRPASVVAIRAAVADAGAVLVAYLRVSGRLHGLKVDARRVTLHDLGDAAEVDGLIRRARADLDVLAYERLPAPIHTAASASLTRSLAILDDLLVRPLRTNGYRLVVVPTGVLAALPWTSIPSRRGEPVVVTPSATAWVTARAVPGAAGELVALAGPDLGRAEHEVDEIGRIRLGARVVAGATRAQLAAAMASAATVHVAAHGQHQTENPLFSSIRMADGPMFAHELEHAAPHVVLSACELGMATIRPGDEALGLTSVLLHLGSRTVVSGVARVGDDAAAEAMLGYHRRLAQGRDSAEALAEAVSAVDEPTPFVTFGV